MSKPDREYSTKTPSNYEFLRFYPVHMNKISDQEHYINLSTQKRDGSFVNTPVWFAQDGKSNSYFIFSLKNAGKIKRIRNFPDVKVANCKYNGELKGDWIYAKAYLITEPKSIRSAYLQLRNKYGIRFRIGDFFSWIIGNYYRRQIVLLKL